MFKKTLPAVVLAGAVALIGAPAAMADHEPGHDGYTAPTTGTVSDPVVAEGEAFVFSDSNEGFTPGETIAITATNEAPEAAGIGGTGGGRLGAAQSVIVLAAVINTTTTADANGNFSISLKLPEPGTWTITARGLESGNVVAAQVTVLAAAAIVPQAGNQAGSSNDGLADTGLASATLVWGAAGLGALGLGAASVAVARRRNA